MSCSDKKEQTVDNYFNNLHDTGYFNGNVLIAKGDSIIYQNSFGYSNSDKSDKLSSGYLFGLGSIYKEFPAVAIMRLVENGLLSINDSLSSYLKHLPAWSNKIQIKHLLNYSSGLPVVDWQSYFQSEKGVNQEIILGDLGNLKNLEAEPGNKYIYSNYNPLLLIKIIEEVAKTDFANYLKEEILLPNRITGIEIENKFPFESKNKFALPFDENFEKDDVNYQLTSICSSIKGMFDWVNQLDDFRIISRESMKILSIKFKNEEELETPLGACNWKGENITSHEHHGSSGNYECLITNVKEKNIFIALLTNQKNRNLFDIKRDLLKMLK